jgi:hypothetical protein
MKKGCCAAGRTFACKKLNFFGSFPEGKIHYEP